MARTYSLGLRAGWSPERQRSPPKRRPIAQRTERGRIGSCHKQPQTRAELATFASLGARRVSRDVTDGGERKRMERETQTKKARTCHSPRAGGRRCLPAVSRSRPIWFRRGGVRPRRCTTWARSSGSTWTTQLSPPQSQELG